MNLDIACVEAKEALFPHVQQIMVFSGRWLKKGEGGVDNTNVLFSDETERRTNRSKGVITKDPHVAGLGLGLA